MVHNLHRREQCREGVVVAGTVEADELLSGNDEVVGIATVAGEF